jgi:hypothetical protein
MTLPSKIARIAAVLALSIALTPTAAVASTLLSGYGGPGQGNQAILGATLLNGPSGGGRGGGSNGGGSSGGGSSSSGEGNLAAPTTTGAQGSASSPRHTGSGSAGKHGAPRGGASASTLNARQAESGAARAYNVSAGGGSAHPLLGLSRDDLLYVVLGLGVLAITGVLTRRLTGRKRAGTSGGSRGAAETPTST